MPQAQVAGYTVPMSLREARERSRSGRGPSSRSPGRQGLILSSFGIIISPAWIHVYENLSMQEKGLAAGLGTLFNGAAQLSDFSPGRQSGQSNL